MQIKLVLGLVATVIAFISYAPYISDVRKGKTKPHVFSWFVWALIAYIAGFAQLKGGGGLGAIISLLSATVCMYIAYLAYKDSSVVITKSDWFSFIASLLAIPIWIITKQPLAAVIIVTAIDSIGFWPTVRKSYNAPHQETISNYWLATIKNALSIGALSKFSAVTLIYPISLIITDGICFLILVTRLKVLSQVKEMPET